MEPDPPRQKADFDSIYDQPDPRSYFTTLEPLDYVIPEHGADVFAELLAVRDGVPGRVPTVLDLCCSYGVVGALLKTDLRMGDLYAHYRTAAAEDVSSEELVAADRTLLRDHARDGAPRVVGMDAAANAIRHAVTTGALDAGATENLEDDEPSAELRELVSDVDLVTVTGGVGYVTERTFGRLLEIVPASAWVASFCLRTYDYAPIAEVLAGRGLRTEAASRTFTQRRFDGPEEQAWALAQVRARGIDPAGKEEAGCFHADFFLSRPAAEVADRPLDQLLSEELFGEPRPA